MPSKSFTQGVIDLTVRGVKGMHGLLDAYSGNVLASFYNEQEKTGEQLIVGAQPLALPHDPVLQADLMRRSNEDLLSAFSSAAVLVGWWYTRTVAVFDKDLLTELVQTDISDLYVDIDQCAKFWGSPVLIPFEQSYLSDDCEVFGCMVGFYGDLTPGRESDIAWFVLLPVLKNINTGEASFSQGLLRLKVKEERHKPLRFLDLIDSIDRTENVWGFCAFKNELATKLAYLLTETPDVNRCMSVSAPSIVRRRKKPSTIFAPNKARVMTLGEDFGNLIRQYKLTESIGGHHGTVRPHVRRAHWHTFLTGAGREKRVLKWLPPTFVKSADLSDS